MDKDSLHSPGRDDLDDDQIEELLCRAEEKCRIMAGTRQPLTNAASAPRIPKLDTSTLPRPCVTSDGATSLADLTRFNTSKEKQFGDGIRRVEDPVTTKRNKLEMRKATAGPDHFNLPRTNATPEFKRTQTLMEMRGVLDPHRHYKKNNRQGRLPEFSQVGTLIEGPTDFYSARLPVRDRKRTFVEEILAGERDNGHFKRKYLEIQAAKTSGKKGWYKAQQVKKYGTNNTRR